MDKCEEKWLKLFKNSSYGSFSHTFIWSTKRNELRKKKIEARWTNK